MLLLNLSLRQAGKSGMKVVYPHCPAAEHLCLLPEPFYQPVIRSAVHVDGEKPDELSDGAGTWARQSSCAVQARRSSD